MSQIQHDQTLEAINLSEATPIAPRRTDIIVTSFYTDDDYYRAHAARLGRALDMLGVPYEFEEMTKPAGADWADMTRRKIGIIHETCQRHPDKMVFWIDIDCSLLSLPDYITCSTADIVGFQRGFSTPMSIGYSIKTRFWEPCFFGINATPAGRRFIADAYEFEQNSSIKATDDYFFEESWRTNATGLTFQIIPSAAMLAKADVDTGIIPFFSFGSSGNVEDFKDKVVQHSAVAGSPLAALPGTHVRPTMTYRALKLAKGIESRLSPKIAAPARRMADQSGLTHLLTQGQHTRVSPAASVRGRNVRIMLAASQRGDVATAQRAITRLETHGILTKAETNAKAASQAFAHYATLDPHRDNIPLSWWSRPFPGNFGDWLSPMLVSSVASRGLTYVPPTAALTDRHLVSVGSIGRFIKANSVVVGTGVSSTDIELDPRADYISLRGPITAKLLVDCGGPAVTSFGDPGALVRRIVPVQRKDLTNGRTLLVRHFKHANVPLLLPADMDEVSVRMSHPKDIEAFLHLLNEYDQVVTSAMHVMIACHSYGIPCALISFEGMEAAVHGSGVKYADYAQGVELSRTYEPTLTGFDLRRLDVDAITGLEFISDAKLDQIAGAITTGVATVVNKA